MTATSKVIHRGFSLASRPVLLSEAHYGPASVRNDSCAPSSSENLFSSFLLLRQSEDPQFYLI
jgi:hypothetical protein